MVMVVAAEVMMMIIPVKVSLPALQVHVELAHVPRPEHDGCPGHTCDDIAAKIVRISDENISSEADIGWSFVPSCRDSL